MMSFKEFVEETGILSESRPYTRSVGNLATAAHVVNDANKQDRINQDIMAKIADKEGKV